MTALRGKADIGAWPPDVRSWSRCDRRGTGSSSPVFLLHCRLYFLSAFVTRFPNAFSERPISRFSSFKVLDLAPPFFLRTVVFIANSSSARSGAIVIAHLRPALHWLRCRWQ